MRITKREVNGVKVTGYKDANEWVVQAADMLPHTFNAKDWTLTEAMEFAARIAAKA